jgi:hypothetical protein
MATLKVRKVAAVVAMAVVLHQEQQRRLRHEVEERWIRYRPPLVVPVAPEFNLDAGNEVFCVEFFR